MERAFALRVRRRVPAATAFDDDEPADHALGRSQGGFGTKLHLVSDAGGIPLNATLIPGQAHESTQLEATLAPIVITRRRTGRQRGRPRRVAGDRAYHARHSAASQPHRPPKRGRPVSYDASAYRGRNAVEHCVGWLKEWRSVVTRFDKLAVNYLHRQARLSHAVPPLVDVDGIVRQNLA
jgi:transposase